DLAAASPAKHRRSHHRRFHRHEEPERPAGGLQPDERTTQARQGQDPRATAFRAGVDGNDPAARPGKPERFYLRKLPVLPGPRRGEDFDDDKRGAASDAQYRDAKISGERARIPSHFESGRIEKVEAGG